MATPFVSRAARVSGAIGRAFGEGFTFLPFTSAGGDVNLPKIPDVSRVQFDATGVWEGPAKSETPHARGAIQDDNAHNWSVSMPSVLVSDANLSWMPRRGDRVVRLFDGATYEISKSMPDSFGATLFFLTGHKR